MEVKLTKVYRTDKDKEGKPLMTKGTPDRPSRSYTRLGIKTQEHGDKWLSGFENRESANWQEGDTVDIEVEPNGQYLNFKTLSEMDKVWKMLTYLQKQIHDLRRNFGEADETEIPKVNEELDEASIKETDLPF